MMKIEGGNPSPENLAARKLERAQAEATQDAVASGGAKTGDRVELSSDAALAQAAVKAVDEAPDVRADLVERMKKALAAGDVGKDAHALAETLIDRMLDEK
jgi:flagellar biosynthesis anti-sigma factor FlgM